MVDIQAQQIQVMTTCLLYTYVVTALKEFEGFKVDPADGTTGCYADKDDATALGDCGYYYTQCDGGGSYRLTTRFEDKANIGKYEDEDDGEPGGAGGVGGSYMLGSFASDALTSCAIGDPAHITEAP